MPVARTLDLPAHFDLQAPFADQVAALADRAALTPVQWQAEPLLVNLPSLGAIAGALLAEIHGRAGYFPAVLRLRPRASCLPPRLRAGRDPQPAGHPRPRPHPPLNWPRPPPTL